MTQPCRSCASIVNMSRQLGKPPTPFLTAAPAAGQGEQIGDLTLVRTERVPLATRCVMALAALPGWLVFADIDGNGRAVGAGVQAPINANAYTVTADQLDEAEHQHVVPAGGLTHVVMRKVTWAEVER